MIDFFNQYFFLSKKCFDWCFREVKWLLFSIEGACQHSGHCCRSITICYDGSYVTSLSRFNDLCRKDSLLSRFSPVSNNDTIEYFDCRCLTDNNICSEYESRPLFCVQYPDNIMLSDAVLHRGCGYFITQRFSLPFFSSDYLKYYISIFKFNNSVKF